MAAMSPQSDSSLQVHSILAPGPLQRVVVTASNTNLLDLIAADTSLSAETRKGYTRALQRIYMGGPGRPGAPAFAPLLQGVSLFWLIKNPEEATSRLQAALSARGVTGATAVKNYTDALMAVARRHPVLSKLADVRGRWKATAESQSATIRQRLAHNQPSDRQRSAFVPYTDIQGKLRELFRKDLGGRDTLLLGLLGLSRCSMAEQWLPQRADYGEVRIFLHPSRPADEEAATTNYMIMDPSNKKGSIVLNAYKTSRTYGQRSVEMPTPFVHMVLASLQQAPREYLFTLQTGPPNRPYTGAAFSCWANRRLRDLFGKALTLSGVRHSYVTWVQCTRQWLQATDAERQALAKRMGHSLATANAYRFAPRHL